MGFFFFFFFKDYYIFWILKFSLSLRKTLPNLSISSRKIWEFEAKQKKFKNENNKIKKLKKKKKRNREREKEDLVDVTVCIPVANKIGHSMWENYENATTTLSDRSTELRSS